MCLIFLHVLIYKLTRTDITFSCCGIFSISLLQATSYLGKNPYIEEDYHTTQCIQYDKDILKTGSYYNVVVFFFTCVGSFEPSTGRNPTTKPSPNVNVRAIPFLNFAKYLSESATFLQMSDY